MRTCAYLSFILVLMVSSCRRSGNNDILPEVPRGAEALSVTLKPLYPIQPTASAAERLRLAKEDWKHDKTDPDKLIWFGRWTAYCGSYREAIRIFTKGAERFPSDARFLRHRGHRYISIREFDRAAADLEKASLLVAFSPDETEPDGMPNAMNIPVSTLKSNIYYHLGLARYLSGDREGALEAWRNDFALNINDDMKVATLHWIYTVLSDMGRAEEALDALKDVTADMQIIENQAYHKLCLFYKGDLTVELLESSEFSSIMNDAMLYGLGSWYLNNGNPEKASEYYSRILAGGAWASFGYIAAEVRLAP